MLIGQYDQQQCWYEQQQKYLSIIAAAIRNRPDTML